MLGEVHFLGYDPTRGIEQYQKCPAYDYAATIVWFEKWIFTGYSIKLIANTGIVYSHCFTSFDVLGNVISQDPIGGLSCCGFSGNTTCTPFTRCPTDDEWLDQARTACIPAGLPAPGTIELAPDFRRDYGWKQRPPVPTPPQ